MNALDTLRLKLRKAFSNAGGDAAWGKPQAMTRALEEVSFVFDRAAEPCSRRSITRSLQSFRMTRKLPTFLDLKYACHGITQETDSSGWKLIEDHTLFPALLERVDAELPQSISSQRRTHDRGNTISRHVGPDDRDASPVSRRFLKCFQGLLSGYFDYNIYSGTSSETGRKNWKSLRSYLHERLADACRVSPAPRWVRVLQEHEDLLSEDLYERYGASLARGDLLELKSVCESLLIPRNSWLWEVTVLLRIRAVCAFEDDVFLKHLDQSLDMISRSKGIVLSGTMKKQCIACLLKRYARCAGRAVHAGLFDATMIAIGNPWADRAAWDASVNDENARAMVSTWIRRRLITDFFRILSEDTPEDRKRLRNWLKFEHKIDDMWFALGPHAFNHSAPEFEEFRRLAGDRILKLENGGRPENNALIMRIEDYVFVEFGAYGYSVTIFKSSNLTFDLDRKWICIGSKPSEQHLTLTHEQALKQHVTGS